jgi:hypothetical protein
VLEGGQRGIEGRLAQRLTAPVSPLVGEVALERLGLLDMERLKVLVSGSGTGERFAANTMKSKQCSAIFH